MTRVITCHLYFGRPVIGNSTLTLKQCINFRNITSCHRLTSKTEKKAHENYQLCGTHLLSIERALQDISWEVRNLSCMKRMSLYKWFYPVRRFWIHLVILGFIGDQILSLLCPYGASLLVVVPIAIKTEPCIHLEQFPSHLAHYCAEILDWHDHKIVWHNPPSWRQSRRPQ